MADSPLNPGFVIAGAGITGLMLALQLTKAHPGRPVTIFDRAPGAGGMYASMTYPDGRIFDYGMHVIYESCNPAVDDLYREIMPADEWHIHAGNEKDIAGLFFRGKLQTYSHYVDLRSFAEETRKTFIAELLLKVGSAPADPGNCRDILVSQFGEAIVEQVHEPILRALYGISAAEASPFAIKASALERVILFDAPVMLDLMKSDGIRSRAAYPDQINLPPYRGNSQKALYPKKFGMGTFTDRLVRLLTARGVRFLPGADLMELRRNADAVTGISLMQNGKSIELPVGQMIWTAGWHPLAQSLGLDGREFAPKPGPRLALANLVFDRAPRMDRLYYFYCYDPGFASFRVTNYAGYCPAAASDAGHPLSVELWPQRLGPASADMSDDQLIQLALAELRAFGVIDEHHLLFGKIVRAGGGFPLPTIENSLRLAQLRNQVKALIPANLTVAGVLAEEGLFFVPDILNDAFSKISRL